MKRTHACRQTWRSQYLLLFGTKFVWRVKIDPKNMDRLAKISRSSLSLMLTSWQIFFLSPSLLSNVNVCFLFIYKVPLSAFMLFPLQRRFFPSSNLFFIRFSSVCFKFENRMILKCNDIKKNSFCYINFFFFKCLFSRCHNWCDWLSAKLICCHSNWLNAAS